MTTSQTSEKEHWESVTDMLQDQRKSFSQKDFIPFFKDPKFLADTFHIYKFIAKLATANKSILELGCASAIASPILSEFAKEYVGIDPEAKTIEQASISWSNKNRSFICDNFLGKTYGSFDSVLCINPQDSLSTNNYQDLFHTMQINLKADGIIIIGTKPHLASLMSEKMNQTFHNVFNFNLFQGMFLCGNSPSSEFLLFLGCNRKGETA